MKLENRKKLIKALKGIKIKDVVIHDSHGLVIELHTDLGDKLTICTYDEGPTVKRYKDEFYVGLNEEDIAFPIAAYGELP